MSQITGTIKLTNTALILPEQLKISLWTIDGSKEIVLAKTLSCNIYKDYSYVIEFDLRDLIPGVNHFIEINYADLRIQTTPDTIENLLKGPIEIALDSSYYYVDVVGHVYDTKMNPLDKIDVDIYRKYVLSANKLNSTTTTADGYYSFNLKLSFSEIFKNVDPEIFPKLKDTLNLKIHAKGNEFESEVFYDVRNNLSLDIIIGQSTTVGVPDYNQKDLLFKNDLELSKLTAEQIAYATKEPEYLSKKLQLPTQEAKQLIMAKHYSNEFACDKEVAFALLKDNPEIDYKDLMFKTNESLAETVVQAINSNIIYTDESTVNGKISQLKASLISAYLTEVSDKLDVIQGTGTLDRIALVEHHIAWKNDPAKQNNGLSLNQYLLDNQIIDIEQYKRADVFEKVENVSINNTELSFAVSSDSNINWASVDDIIASKDNFETLITGYLNNSKISLPEGINDAAEYAKHMTKQLEVQYPSQFLKCEIKKPGATLFAGTNIATIINNNADFQFGQKHGWSTLADPNINLEPLTDEQKLQLKKDLQEAEQIYRLTPESNKCLLAGIMKDTGLTSSYKIAKLSRTAFVEQMSNLLPEDHDVSTEDLNRIYDTSNYITAIATLDFIDVCNSNTQTVTNVIPSVSYTSTDESDGFPSLYELFGSQDYFEYPPCRTLLSQAAYFTDILNFLKSSGTTPKTGRLFELRPDLQHILLNCTNTERILPYIDLVNEILEREVIRLNTPGNVLPEEMYKLQTSWTNEELAAHPENLHITSDAYNYLNQATAPWSLPFNLSLEEYRTYLKTMGLSREKIIELFTPSTNSALKAETLTESLGLSTKDVECITISHTSPETLNNYYPGIVANIGVGNVKRLTEITDLSYDKLKELLESYFINPVNDFGNRYFLYTIPGLFSDIPPHLGESLEETPGTLNSTYIMNNDVYGAPGSQPSPDPTFYDKLHRFERLRRKLNLKVYQLDLILNYLDCETLNYNDLIKVAYFYKVKSQLNLKLEECLLLFNDFIKHKEYSDYTNLYDYIFLKKTEEYPLKENFMYLIGHIDENPNPNDFTLENIQTILPYISGVKITEQQYHSIIQHEWSNLPSPTLEVLSKIIRTVLMCKSMKISVDEYYFLRENFGSEIDNPIGMFEFIESITKLKKYGFSIPDLAYLLKNINVEGNKIYKSTEYIKDELSELRTIIKPVDKKQYRKHVIENSPKLFNDTIELALDLVFNEISTENESNATSFISTHIDLFNNFNSLYLDENSNQVSLLNYFITNKSVTNKKLQAVLVGLGIENSLLTIPKRKITREILKKNFTKIKTNILLQIIELEPIFVKFDERFDLSHNSVSNLTSIFDTNIELDSRPYTQNTSRTSSNNSSEQSGSLNNSNSESGTGKDQRVGISGYKYSAAAKKTGLLNVASNSVDVDYRQAITATAFITANPSAFPANTDFLTNNQSPDYSEDVDLRYINYVTKMDQGVLETKTIELRNLISLYVDQDKTETAVEIILNIQNNLITDEERKLFIEDYFSAFIPRIEAIDCLWDIQSTNYITNPCLRLDYVIDFLKQESRVDKIVAFFAEKFSCGEDVMAKLLFEFSGESDGSPLIDHFSNRLFYAGTITSTTDILNYRILYKSCLVINEFRINLIMLDKIWEIIQAEDPAFNILNIFNLKGIETNQILPYLNLSTAIGLSHTYFTEQNDFFSFFTNNNDLQTLSPEAVSHISEISGCKLSDLEALINFGTLPFNLYINWFSNILECQKIIKQCGTTAQSVISLNKTDQSTNGINYKDSEMLRQIVKNKYSDEEWFKVAASLRNPLREKQRDALRDYIIINTEDFTDANDLFGHFLIDTEMTTAVKTSRITQATLSVQLFIQRVLMGLEGDLKFNDDEKKEIEWRKNYRVWEANRKILFFPENWLDPELRHDKSPFFKELEEKLLQNDIDETSVGVAYKEYLEKLDEVSNLEILAVYREAGLPTYANNQLKDASTIHFIGRTQNAPHKFFYRRLENICTWTAWQEIENGIKADMVKLEYWKGNLYMFWPEVFVTNQVNKDKEYAYSSTEYDSDSEDDNKRQFVAIKMAWSVLKNGQWSKAVFSNDIYIEPDQRANISNIVLSSSFDLNKVYVAISFRGNDYINAFYRGHYEFNGTYLNFFYSADENPQWNGTSNQNIILTAHLGNYIKNNKAIVKYRNSKQDILYLKLRYHTELPADNQYNVLSETQGDLYELSTNMPTKTTVLFDNMACWYRDYRLEQHKSWFKPLVIQDHSSGISFLGIPYLNQDSSFNLKTTPDDKYKLKYRFIPFSSVSIDSIKQAFLTAGVEGLFNTNQQTGISEFKINGTDFSTYFNIDLTNIPYSDPTGGANYDSLKKGLFFANIPVNNPNVAFKTLQDPFALYNWELFYHIPITIAVNLSTNMKFEDATKWFHLIFDPTSTSNDTGALKYWKIKPFREYISTAGTDQSPSNITEFIEAINENESNSSVVSIVEDWEKSPFNPHLIAKKRPESYMKYVVVKYIENLLGWADMLFTKDTMEDVNQAIQLYVLASEILGIKPQKLEGTLPDEESFLGLGDLDALSNSFEAIDGILTVVADLSSVSTSQTGTFGSTEYNVSYFGIPHNSKMEAYWDIVADRLFKIRHSMNIHGVVRELPLTAPPIDPGAIAAALASGADLSSALSTLSAPMPLYRFNYMLQKAIEFTNDVKALGNMMLSVLEKKDAEDMALLRSSMEQAMLNAMTQIREKAIDEANENINSLDKSKENIENRRSHYTGKQFMNALEAASIQLNTASMLKLMISAGAKTGAAVPHSAPQAGVGPMPYIEQGGENIANATKDIAEGLDTMVSVMQTGAALMSTLGSYAQRKDDWNFQASQASGELSQIEMQIAAANIRLAMAEKELENHKLQIDQKKEEYEFMKSKFTNKQLYNWMKGEVSKLYQSAFQMAHKLALAAEKAYLFERQKDNYRSFITTAYWDNLREGLMAGELLYNDLRRLEMEYMETNSRDLELSKDIPLSMIAPQALIDLQTNGSCNFDIPEMLYDIDHPGHYMRRIKAVSISIPAITGPYSGVSCKLSMLSNRFRKSTSIGSTYAYQGIDDLRFVHNIIGIQSIATSTGNNDTGMFEFNFRDERYLPFEGAGAIGSWSIELPNTIRKFDYESISDVILHVKYTARDAGGTLKKEVEETIEGVINGTIELLSNDNFNFEISHSMKSEFADALYELVNIPINTTGEAIIEISKKHFPFIFTNYVNKTLNKSIFIDSIVLFSKNDLTGKLFDNDVLNSEQEVIKTWTPVPDLNLELYSYTTAVQGQLGTTTELTLNSENLDALEEVYLLINFTIE